MDLATWLREASSSRPAGEVADIGILAGGGVGARRQRRRVRHDRPGRGRPRHRRPTPTDRADVATGPTTTGRPPPPASSEHRMRGTGVTGVATARRWPRRFRVRCRSRWRADARAVRSRRRRGGWAAHRTGRRPAPSHRRLGRVRRRLRASRRCRSGSPVSGTVGAEHVTEVIGSQLRPVARRRVRRYGGDAAEVRRRRAAAVLLRRRARAARPSRGVGDARHACASIATVDHRGRHGDAAHDRRRPQRRRSTSSSSAARTASSCVAGPTATRRGRRSKAAARPGRSSSVPRPRRRSRRRTSARRPGRAYAPARARSPSPGRARSRSHDRRPTTSSTFVPGRAARACSVAATVGRSIAASRSRSSTSTGFDALVARSGRTRPPTSLDELVRIVQEAIDPRGVCFLAHRRRRPTAARSSSPRARRSGPARTRSRCCSRCARSSSGSCRSRSQIGVNTGARVRR